jgi:outer membrane protein assembly factor BamE (lipoprotein component of BamABCDE complex)
MRFSSATVAWIAVISVLISGCSVGNGAPSVVEGKRFPLEKVKEIRTGSTSAEVHRVLGLPFRMTRVGERETWIYYDREKREESLLLNGVSITTLSRHYYVAEAVVTLRGGVVEAVSHREGNDDARGQ